MFVGFVILGIVPRTPDAYMTILRQLFEIILLQRRPRDLQYDEFSAVFYVVFSIGLSYVVHVAGDKYSSPLGYAVVPTLAVLGILYAILSASRKQNRFVQTVTAMFGAQTVIGMATIVISSIGVLHVLLPLFIVWNMFIGVLVVKDGLDASWVRALFILIGIQFLSIVAVILLFPDFLLELQQVTGFKLPSEPV